MGKRLNDVTLEEIREDARREREHEDSEARREGPCERCDMPRSQHFHPEEWPQETRWHCAQCGKPMQFADGICFACNGGEDPGR